MNFRPYVIESVADKAWSKGKINVSGPRPYTCSLYLHGYLPQSRLLTVNFKEIGI